ncbi:MAG: hypothetical protein PUK48_02115, partial [Spirochaetales bacterium]|nr:hypothetical protein [Spirochaetales bacterium]
TCYELIKGVRFAYHYKKEKSYNRQQTDTLFKKRKMSALRIAESIMRLPCMSLSIKFTIKIKKSNICNHFLCKMVIFGSTCFL